MSLKKVIAYIKRNKSFLITTHTNPEADAIGSELALYRLLKILNKRVTIINEDPLPYGHSFLPCADKIIKFKNNLKNIKFDCFIILDCSDLTRCGEVYRLNMDNKPIINIDHHISNERFGDINWVDTRVSSCAQLIYELYKKIHLPLDRKIALLLYVGIMSDTGSFRYSNTNSLTHRIASELLQYNLNVWRIYRNLYGNIPFEDMRLLISILPTMKLTAEGKVVWFQIRQNLLRNRKLSFDLSESVLNFGRSVKDAEVVVLFKENLGVKDEIRVNFRSQGKIDVNKIAQYFGGGGHKTAAGATVKGKIDQVRKEVLAKIRESLK